MATRTNAGLFDFSFMGLYEFPGARELQGLQTRNLQTVEPGQLVYTLFLNEDGGVFNDATAWRLPNGSWWVFTGRRSDYTRWKNIARDRSGEYTILALQGPHSGRLLSSLVGKKSVVELRYFHFIQKGSLTVARLGYSGELGYELLMPAAEKDLLWSSLADAGATPCGAEAMNSLRIESGYVIFDREIDGRANPAELGLERLVFPARKFPVKKRLAGLEIQEKPMEKNLPQAVPTSECFSPTLEKRIGLGFVPPEARGEARLADGRGARIVPLPFYDPGRRRPRGAPL